MLVPLRESVFVSSHVILVKFSKLFLECANNGEAYLDQGGLHTLCEKLNLLSSIDLIIERVLCGYNVVDFPTFKERFVRLLPEIVNFDSIDIKLQKEIEKTLSQLGFNLHSFLNQYDIRLICENTPQLNRLNTVDINDLFGRADSKHAGRITINQFLNQYQIQKQLNDEVNFIAETFAPSVNLFEAIDTNNTGIVDVQQLVEHWATCGINIEQSLAALKETGLPLHGSINTISLSGKLERELSDVAISSSASNLIRVALLSLHAYIDHLRYLSKEGESRCDHLHKQLQLANQRRNLLIEELEQNQASVEESYEQRLRECEERYRARISQLEERFSTEKRDLIKEVERMEEELSRVRYSESTCKTRLQLVERQCARFGEEAQEMAESMQKMEHANRQLRAELGKALHPRQIDENAQILMWRRRVEFLLAHNKKLRDKIDEMASSKKKYNFYRKINPLYFHWTNSFRLKVLAIRKRRIERNNSLSEMESEPESIFIRVRRRRLLKVRERMRIHQRIEQSVNANKIAVEGTSSEETVNSLVRNSTSERNLVSLLEKKHEELKRLKDEHRREISALKLSANKALSDALNDQQRQITQSFEKERWQFDVRLASERNALERKFAEEKMKLINRLQEEFDLELNRLKALISPCVSDDSYLYKNQNEFAELPNELSSKKMDSHNAKFTNCDGRYLNRKPQDCSVSDNAVPSTSAFVLLIEKYRKSAIAPTNKHHFIEKRSSNSIEKASSHSSLPIFFDKLKQSPLPQKCNRCELIDKRLKELLSVISNENIVIESGFEDIDSSIEGINEEVSLIKTENKTLKSRLELLRVKIIELRLCLSGSGTMYRKYDCMLGGSENSEMRQFNTKNFAHNFCGSMLVGNFRRQIIRLEAEKALLNARLIELKELVKHLVNKYKEQLDETSRLGDIFRRIYSKVGGS